MITIKNKTRKSLKNKTRRKTRETTISVSKNQISSHKQGATNKLMNIMKKMKQKKNNSLNHIKEQTSSQILANK